MVYSVHLVQLNLFWSIQSTSVLCDPLRSIPSNSVHSVCFSPIWSIQSTLVYSVQFGPLRSTLACSVHLIYFRSLWSNSVYLLKNGKKQVWVESTINYLSNIGYCNNLLKRMRIRIINLKLKNFNCSKRNLENIMHNKYS